MCASLRVGLDDRNLLVSSFKAYHRAPQGVRIKTHEPSVNTNLKHIRRTPFPLDPAILSSLVRVYIITHPNSLLNRYAHGPISINYPLARFRIHDFGSPALDVSSHDIAYSRIII